MPALSANRTVPSRSTMRTLPSSTARAVAPPVAIASRVAGPMVGMSNRKSWPSATALTTTAPGPPRLVPRCIVSSVPSAASTAKVTPRDRTTLWPIPYAARCRASAKPAWISLHSAGVGARTVRVPAPAIHGSSDVATKIVRRTHTAEHLLLPQLADKDDRADLGVAERAHHFLKVGERARDDPLGVRFDSSGCVEGESDDLPALAGGFRGGTAGEDPGPRHHREAALHGRSFGQAISPRPSRIILSISNATARDRRSSV